MLAHFLFVLMTLSLNAFSAAVTTFCEAYDAWIKSLQFLRFGKVAYGTAGPLMLLLVQLMLQSPDNQYFLQNYELHNLCTIDAAQS